MDVGCHTFSVSDVHWPTLFYCTERELLLHGAGALALFSLVLLVVVLSRFSRNLSSYGERRALAYSILLHGAGALALFSLVVLLVVLVGCRHFNEPDDQAIFPISGKIRRRARCSQIFSIFSL